jgi:hypothetical protein
MLIALAFMPFVAVLVHELGHAAFALWATEGPVFVSVGREPPIVRARLARLELALHPLPPDRGLAGFARVRATLAWDDRLAFALAGPFANVMLALALTPLVFAAGRIDLTAAGYAGYSLLLAAWNLLPFRRHGHRSDGLAAIEAWRQRQLRTDDPRGTA